MCVILACEDKLPSFELLESCETMNPHGGGIAWLDHKKNVHYQKGLDAKEIYSMIESNIIQLPCIVHFRIASVGDVVPELCHPFPITDKSELDLTGVMSPKTDGVLFHNGTILNHEQIIKDVVMLANKRMLKGELSDSRIMAFAVKQYGHEFIPSLDDDDGNKYAILDSKGITKYGNWHDDEGIKASNNYYKMQWGATNNGYMYNDDFGDYEQSYDEYGINSLDSCRYTKHDANKELSLEYQCIRDELNDDDTFDYFKDGIWQRTGKGVWQKVNPKNGKTLMQAQEEEINKELQQKLDSKPLDLENDEGIKALMGDSIKKPKKMRKRDRKAHRKFLKKCGWIHPEKLSDKDLIEWVEFTQTNQGVMKKFKQKDFKDGSMIKRVTEINELEKELKETKLKKYKLDNQGMDAEDYENLYYMNEEWINRMNESIPMS